MDIKYILKYFNKIVIRQIKTKSNNIKEEFNKWQEVLEKRM